jgi:hypothetical protein
LLDVRVNPLCHPARKGISMKRIFAALVLCACATTALAAGPECRAIESARDRLACYDTAALPKKDKPAETDAARAAYKDPLIEEDARIAAKLKNICRGC